VEQNEPVKATVKVTNTGIREGTEIVQLYIQDLVASVTRPMKELKGFQKIQLKPGETKSIVFEISPEMLSFYDINLKKVIEPGLFQVLVGGNSEDLVSAEFELVE
jgi:beta-glucosidase